MQLGKLQKEWVKSLREHPERQQSGSLGTVQKKDGTYKACCLGEYLACKARAKGLDVSHIATVTGSMYDEEQIATGYLTHSYKELGLHDQGGGLIDNATLGGFDSLALANDNGVSWEKIADFIEYYPEKVFARSV